MTAIVEAGSSSVNEVGRTFTPPAVARTPYGFYTVEATIHAPSSGK